MATNPGRTRPPEPNGAIPLHLRFVHAAAGAAADQAFSAINSDPVADGAFADADPMLAQSRAFVCTGIHVHCTVEGVVTLRDGADVYGPFTPPEGWNPANLPHHPHSPSGVLRFRRKVAPKISVDASFVGVVELFGFLVPG